MTRPTLVERRTLTDTERHEGVVTALSAMHAALLALLAGHEDTAREQAIAATGVVETLEADIGDPVSSRDMN